MAEYKKIEKLQLIEKIKELYYSRKYSIAEISTILKVTERTLYRYMKRIEEEFEKTHKSKTVEDYRKENTEAHEKVLEKMWLAYDQEVNPRLKASILNMIEKARNNFIIDLQNLHVISKPKETTDMNLKGELLERLRYYQERRNEKKE